MQILVVDDDRAYLKLIDIFLNKYGHNALLVDNAQDAVDMLLEQDIDLVITDWHMPGTNGLELCKYLRAETFPRYIYCILLTGRQDKDSLVQGMDAGADDFIVKPFHAQELRVRINAGKRIIDLKRQISKHNQQLQNANLQLTKTNIKLSKAYQTIRTDLQAAAKLQKSMLPYPTRFDALIIDWLFLPSLYLAGDMLGYFPIDQNHIGFYQLDVAGHGTASALQSFRVCTLIAMLQDLSDKANSTINPPDQVVYEINQRLAASDNLDLYVTMVYGVINLDTKLVTVTQAGHPAPVWQQTEKMEIINIGEGGYPIGIFENLEYDSFQIQLSPGDRLFIYSDGIIECKNQRGDFYTNDRLISLLDKNAKQPVQNVIQILKESLREWKGDDKFEDDISLLAIEWSYQKT